MSDIGTTNLYFYDSILLHVNNVSITIKDFAGTQYIIEPGQLCYIEKGTAIDVLLHHVEGSLKKNNKEPPYKIYHMDNSLINYLCDIMMPFFNFNDSYSCKVRSRILVGRMTLENEVFLANLDKLDISIYCLVYSMAYILSITFGIENIIHSLICSKKVTFTEKVKSVIDRDITRSWKLSDISVELQLPVPTVRMRMKKEGGSLRQLLLDIRMHTAARMLTNTEKSIKTVGYDIGYKNISHFIYTFKNYFGFTPKVFCQKIKGYI